jgi:hypothetical protein
MTLQVHYRAPSQFTVAELDEIWQFFSRFVQRSREAFEAKLSRCEEVFLGRTTDGRLAAFGAIDALSIPANGEIHGVIVTHWTSLDPSVRGSNVIQRVGFRYYLRYRLRYPTRRIYWLFGASTYKSYLLLARNCKSYWPREGVDWPTRERSLVDAVMARSEDPGWDQERGVVRRFGASLYREGIVEDNAAASVPAIRFYGSLNPGQEQGDTLICICPLSMENWLSIGRAALGRSMRQRSR